MNLLSGIGGDLATFVAVALIIAHIVGERILRYRSGLPGELTDRIDTLYNNLQPVAKLVRPEKRGR